MNLLIDTHVAIWAVDSDPKLPRVAKLLLADPNNQLFVSAVSIWEISIKYALRRQSADPINISGHEAITLFEKSGFSLLPITSQHAAAVDHLPALHGDPFDRLLVAKAAQGEMQLVTHDPKLAPYGDFVIIV